MMITDTGHLRNKHYHRATDTLKTLNIVKMAQVIDGLTYSLIMQAEE